MLLKVEYCGKELLSLPVSKQLKYALVKEILEKQKTIRQKN